MVELALLGSVRPPLPRSAVVPRLERFLGFLVSNVRVVVLTNERVLVLPRRPGAAAWYDVQLDRRRVHAEPQRRVGRLSLVDLVTGVGPQTAAFTSAEDAGRLARALGAHG